MTPNACTARSAAYTFTEVLHYADGATVVSRCETVRREPSLAVSRIATDGNGFRFWNDHDPRIVAVEYTYAPA
jgi:hypothetical protein